MFEGCKVNHCIFYFFEDGVDRSNNMCFCKHQQLKWPTKKEQMGTQISSLELVPAPACTLIVSMDIYRCMSCT